MVYQVCIFLKEQKTCNGLFDIPTIVSSMYDRAKDEAKRKHKKGKSYDINFEDIQKEIIDFQVFSYLYYMTIDRIIFSNLLKRTQSLKTVFALLVCLQPL